MAAAEKERLNEKIAAAQAAEEANLAAQALKAELKEKIAAAQAAEAANLAAQAAAQVAEKESLETYKRWKKREAEQQEMLEGADRLAMAFVELQVEKELTKLYNETEPHLTPEKVFTLTLI